MSTKLFEVHRFSKARCIEIFKGDGKIAMQLKKSDPAAYDEARAAAVHFGILDGPAPNASPIVRAALAHRERENTEATKSYTDEQLKATRMFSRERCEELLKRSGQSGNQDNLSNLKRHSPDEYRLFQLAAYTLGLRENPPAPERAPSAPVDSRIVIPDDLREFFNLPADAKAEPEHVIRMRGLAEQLKAAKESA